MNLRAFALSSHRYFGLALLFFVLSAGLTGSLLVFRHELDYSLNADAVHVAPGLSRLSVEAMVDRLKTQRPGARVERFVIGKASDEAWLFTLENPGEAQPSITEVWLDPYTGRVTGERNTEEVVLDRRHFMAVIWKWHSSLFMGTWGKTLCGAIALLWMLTSLIGIYLALPRGRGLLKALQIKRSGSVFKTVFDSHRVAGLFTFIVLFVSLFTAANLALPDQSRYLVKMLTATRSPMPQALADRPVKDAMVSFDQALGIAQGEIPGAALTGVVTYPRKGVYLVRLRTEDDIASTHGTGRVVIDMNDGAVVHSESFRSAGGTGNTLLTWMYPLHTGQAYGTAGRLLILLVGVFPVFLASTGMWIWWHKRRIQSLRIAGFRLKP